MDAMMSMINALLGKFEKPHGVPKIIPKSDHREETHIVIVGGVSRFKPTHL